jgi:phage portal protein BeeE
MSIPPETAQFLASRAFQVLEICRIFRLPPHKLQDFSTAHLSNLETANEDYIISCLGPWARRIEKCINHRLIGWEAYNAGSYVKHDFRSLILRTAKDEADFYQKMFQIGYYTVDEIKAMRNDNPIGKTAGGDKRFVMSNLADLSHPETGHPGKATQEKPPDGEPGRPEGAKSRFSTNGAAA